VETTRLLIDNKEEREHSRRPIAITSGGAGVVSDGQRRKDEAGVQKESSKDEHGNRWSLRKWIWGRDTERRLDGRKCSAEKLVALWTSEAGAK
jgi:hypothetical protein